MRIASWLAAGAALACAAAAGAENVTADPERIAEALRDAGYRAEVLEESPAQRYIRTGTGGLEFSIAPQGCDEAGDNCLTVMFYAWFDDDTPPSLEDMNLYSSRRRWGRFYIDSEGDPTMEMDVDLEDGGMSPELFIDNVEYWGSALDDFDQFLASGIVPAQ